MATIPLFSDLTNRYMYDTVAARCDKAHPIVRQTLYRGAFAATGVVLLGTKAVDGVIGGVAGTIAAVGHFITIFVAPKALRNGTFALRTFAATQLAAVGLGDVYTAAMNILNPKAKTPFLHRHVWTRLVYTKDAALLVLGKIAHAILGTIGAAFSPLPFEEKATGGISHCRSTTACFLAQNGLADIFTCALKVLNPNATFYGSALAPARTEAVRLSRMTADDISAYERENTLQTEIVKQLRQINTDLQTNNPTFSVSMTYEFKQFLLSRTKGLANARQRIIDDMATFRENVSTHSQGKTGSWVATTVAGVNPTNGQPTTYIEYSKAP